MTPLVKLRIISVCEDNEKTTPILVWQTSGVADSPFLRREFRRNEVICSYMTSITARPSTRQEEDSKNKKFAPDTIEPDRDGQAIKRHMKELSNAIAVHLQNGSTLLRKSRPSLVLCSPHRQGWSMGTCSALCARTCGVGEASLASLIPWASVAAPEVANGTGKLEHEAQPPYAWYKRQMKWCNTLGQDILDVFLLSSVADALGCLDKQIHREMAWNTCKRHNFRSPSSPLRPKSRENDEVELYATGKNPLF